MLLACGHTYHYCQQNLFKGLGLIFSFFFLRQDCVPRLLAATRRRCRSILVGSPSVGVAYSPTALREDLTGTLTHCALRVCIVPDGHGFVGKNVRLRGRTFKHMSTGGIGGHRCECLGPAATIQLLQQNGGMEAHLSIQAVP